MRIKTNKRLYLILAILSISAAAIATFLLGRLMNPYNLAILQQEERDGAYKNKFIIYHDFDKDGFSETVVASNNRKSDNSSLAVLDFSRMFVDECGYWEPLLGDWRNPWLAFEDINKDGYDELFAFTEQEDSLFLYIHDLRTKQAILSRHFLLKERRQVGNKGGDFVINLGGFIDIGKDGGRGFVFTAVSGLKPRGVYLFDTEKLKIVKRFEAEIFPGSVLLYDLTGDGKEEIIVTGQAVGNIHYPAQYSDDRCWLFVLDQNLQPVFEPLSFGEYSSRLSCSPIEINSERFLLLSYVYFGNKNLQDFMCLVNSDGKKLPRRYFSEGIISTLVGGPIVNKRTDPPSLYATSRNGRLLKINESLSIIHKKSTSLGKFSPFQAIFPSHLIDLNRDGSPELICRTTKDIQIYDEQLRLLASFPAPSIHGAITFRETGEGNPLELSLNTNKHFYRLAFRKNALFQGWPLSWLGLSGFTFLLLSGGYRFSALVYTFLSFFRFSLIKTANGVLILNSTGRISFLNHRVQTLLDLKHPIAKGLHFTAAFEQKPQLREWIQKGMDSGKPVKKKMSVIQANHQFEGEIRVTPFISSFNLISACLVEIQDYTQPIISERLQMWSKSVQKIAHDIKTPLSSVALNLKALQIRLENMPLSKREQINDDIEMMRTELRRVHNMTRSFLKFTNLEKPNFQVVSALEIIAEAVAKFDAFTNSGIEIQSELDSGGNDIWADPQQVELVLHILIENAIDALQGKGQIKINTSMAQYLDKSFQKFLEVEVSDTGPGIDSNSRDKIFEPYFTTKPDGTGMGLAIARKIVEDHGGVIGLHANFGFGAVIRFALPLYEDNASSEKKSPNGAKYNSPGQRPG